MGHIRPLRIAGIFLVCAGPVFGASPTSITYTILHSDCHDAGVDSLALSMNGHVLRTVPAKAHCNCGESALVVTITDPALLALYDPSTCNSFAVSSSPYAATPSPGSGFWYLSRSWNFCAYGSWGAASDGTPRTPSACGP